MGANAKTVQPTSQASPLAGDVLGMFQEILGRGGLTGGTSPLNRQAMNSMENFLTTGGMPFDMSPLLGQLEEMQNRRTGESVAGLREGMSVGGTSFGTSAGVGESMLRRDLETNFAANVGNLLMQEHGAQRQGMLAGMSMAPQMTQANMMPFLQLAMSGIFPTETFFEQSPWLTGLQTLAGGAAGAGNLMQGING